jgi:hypothetical protein
MKQLGIAVLAACLMAAGCGDDDSTSPSTTNPTTVVFTSQLSALNEVPPVSNAESTGRGTATITLHLTRAASGAIESGNVDFSFSLNSFPSGTVIVGAHIHPGVAGTNGQIQINTGMSAGNSLTLVGGTGAFEVKGVTSGADAATLQAIVDNPSAFYFNVHSTLNPGGAARGQLVKQ